jgi:EpsI family protein
VTRRRAVLAPAAILLVMLAAAWLAHALTPRAPLFGEHSRPDLAALIPTQFAGWREDAVALSIPSGEVEAQLEQLYDQTLTRIYTDDRGRRVILVIAYGGVQSRALQVHRPEVCYTAQGFQEVAKRLDTVGAGATTIPVMRLVMTQGQRYEPITYWVRIGGRTVRGNLEQGFARLNYGLRGVIPDGLLFRVSSIGLAANAAFAEQDEFVRDLLHALPAADRELLIGAAAPG